LNSGDSRPKKVVGKERKGAGNKKELANKYLGGQNCDEAEGYSSSEGKVQERWLKQEGEHNATQRRKRRKKKTTGGRGDTFPQKNPKNMDRKGMS